MILVDTSVWVGFLKHSAPRLKKLLAAGDGAIATHAMVVGELALSGQLRNRSLLTILSNLSMAKTATLRRYLSFVEERRVAGHGIGYVDANLLLSCIDQNMQLWTLDKSLAELAEDNCCLFSSKI